jgi:general secretion pathway protein D
MKTMRYYIHLMCIGLAAYASCAEKVSNTAAATTHDLVQEAQMLDTAKKDSSGLQQQNLIELQFENADLQNFITQIEAIFDVTILTDDMVQPMQQGVRSVKGHKISFRTHVPLSREHAWNLFITFLQIAGFTIVEHNIPKTYRVIPLGDARVSAIPAYIGVDYTELPDNDEIVRYLYFVENTTLDSIRTVIDPIRSTASSFVLLQDHKAFILTDRAYNIKILMKIVKELDNVSVPESMSILQLHQADAQQVKELYDSLVQTPEDRSTPQKVFTKKEPTSLYFSESVRIIAEPRKNVLILLGPKDAIKKIEDFIKKHIDVELDQPYSPLYVHQLQYADAETIADIMNNITQFGRESEAGKNGGIRGHDQYLRPMTFVPERETNRLIIKGHFDDYIKAKEVIERLDEAQPQVGIEVLIVSIILNDNRMMGTQMRSKVPGVDGLLGNNIKFQTSGLYGTSQIVQYEPGPDTPTVGVQRLLGNIINLAAGGTPGTTLLALGNDAFGVWGLFEALQTVSDAELVANPFLIATNKTPALVSLGQTRRVPTAIIVGGTGQETSSFDNDAANLSVNITPQINSDGMIILDLDVTLDEFTDLTDFTDATKEVREVKTSTIVADKEILAIGGLIRNRVIDHLSKVPVLGDIPVLGWLFKNRSKRQVKENLLILISAQILEPHSEKDVRRFTKNHIDEYHGTLDQMTDIADRRDPIHKMFFKDTNRPIDDFIFDRKERDHEKIAARRQRKRRKKSSPDTTPNDKNVEKPVVIAAREHVPPPPPPSAPLHEQPQGDILSTKIRKRKRTALSVASLLDADKKALA